MSGLGIKTRKVTTYGKKKTQIISVRSDFTPEKKSTSPIVISDDSPSPSRPKPQKTTRDTTRRPLSSKPLQDVISSRMNVPLDIPSLDIKTTKGKSVGKDDSEAVTAEPKVRKIARPRSQMAKKTMIPRIPRNRESFDCVKLVIPARGKTPVEVIENEVIDLTNDLSSLDIGPSLSPSTASISRPDLPPIDILETLLSACTNTSIQPFGDFLSSSIMLNLVPGRGQPDITKVGEASYSEVYSIERGRQQLVIKVIPLSPACALKQGGDIPDCSNPSDVKREVEITERLSGLGGSGFVGYEGAFVVQGSYPTTLLDQWDEYAENNKTESIRPDGFSSEQTYALIVLADGGDDLESFKFDRSAGWTQAQSIYWQIVKALAQAEEAYNFEHRDLHEGQILITPVPVESDDLDALDPRCSGVEATMIDFGLSRITIENGRVVWSDLPEDIYEGVGDQWDVYRAVRDEVNGEWEDYHPLTNVMWLRYILNYIIHSKDLRKPRQTKVDNGSAVSSPIKTRRIPLTRRKDGDKANVRSIEAHVTLKAIEKALGEALAKKKGARAFRSAGDVLYFGREMGWVR